MVSSNDKTDEFHMKSEGICMWKSVIEAISNKVDRQSYFQILPTTPTKVAFRRHWFSLTVTHDSVVLPKTKNEDWNKGKSWNFYILYLEFHIHTLVVLPQTSISSRYVPPYTPLTFSLVPSLTHYSIRWNERKSLFSNIPVIHRFFSS